MDGLAVAELKSVVAPLNFLVPMAEKAGCLQLHATSGGAGKSEEHWVTIRDARPLIDQLSLD